MHFAFILPLVRHMGASVCYSLACWNQSRQIVALVVSFDNIKLFENDWVISNLILCMQQRIKRSHSFERSRDRCGQALS